MTKQKLEGCGTKYVYVAGKVRGVNSRFIAALFLGKNSYFYFTYIYSFLLLRRYMCFDAEGILKLIALFKKTVGVRFDLLCAHGRLNGPSNLQR